MSTCKWCGKSSFFLYVSEYGLCNQCSPVVLMDYQESYRLMKSSLEVIEKSKNLETIITRFQFILERIGSLRKYEEKGIFVLANPSTILSEISAKFTSTLNSSLHEEVDQLLAVVKVTQSNKTRVTQLNRYLVKLHAYKNHFDKPPAVFQEVEERVLGLIHKITLDSYIDDAQKAEFKGQTKPALNKYLEALYFLRTDGIDDRLQKQWISKIEKKIIDLGGNVEHTGLTQ